MKLSGTLVKNSDVRGFPSNEPIRIDNLLGSGGQGEVYHVNYRDQSLALKWFHDRVASQDQRKCIEDLVSQGRPAKNFLWPLELAVLEGSKSFGYLMELRDKRFESFDSLVTGKVDPSFAVLMTVGLNLVESFHNLHAKGLCYRDINFGNGFFDLNSGEVLICDNDNVAANDSAINTVLGTQDFMAPEVVLGNARPRRETDYFSLSVLLFYLFHIHHPLMGKKILSIRCWDIPAREKLFGSEPVFIFDPKDKSNEAIDNKKLDPLGEAGKVAIPYWKKIYPTILKEAFIRSFTVGCREPEQRLLGSEWKRVLATSLQSIYHCHSCSRENFFDPSATPRGCWNCGTPTAPRFFADYEVAKVPLSKGTKLFAYQFSRSDFVPDSAVTAEVVEHPTQAGVWGLCNRTQGNWSATVENKNVEIPPSKSIPLQDGTAVRIGSHRLQIVASKG